MNRYIILKKSTAADGGLSFAIVVAVGVVVAGLIGVAVLLGGEKLAQLTTDSINTAESKLRQRMNNAWGQVR